MNGGSELVRDCLEGLLSCCPMSTTSDSAVGPDFACTGLQFGCLGVLGLGKITRTWDQLLRLGYGENWTRKPLSAAANGGLVRFEPCPILVRFSS